MSFPFREEKVGAHRAKPVAPPLGSHLSDKGMQSKRTPMTAALAGGVSVLISLRFRVGIAGRFGNSSFAFFRLRKYPWMSTPHQRSSNAIQSQANAQDRPQITKIISIANSNLNKTVCFFVFDFPPWALPDWALPLIYPRHCCTYSRQLGWWVGCLCK